ncbi:hypothetical protein PHYPO_G00237130, partial [Pangasianodon hypophthalmus]
MRHVLAIPPPGDEPDIATFYQNVIGLIRELVDDARAVAGRGDLVQLSVEGENVSVHASVVADGTGENILPVFEDTLDRLVQSNTGVVANERVDLIVQVVRNPRGGGKRKLEKTLDCEIIRKKRRHLYVTEGRGDQLCFAISLAHVCNSSFTDGQCERQAREWQRAVGLDEQTPVTFSDVRKFEDILERKIVVFYRTSSTLSHFETHFPDRSQTLFLFLLHNHYYGIKKLKGFIGTRFVCNYCYKGFNCSYVHSCRGYCHICNNGECPMQEYNPVECSDCLRKCRSPACFARHKEGKRNFVTGRSISLCELVKKCARCSLCYNTGPNTRVGNGHRCAKPKCRICGETLTRELETDHRCYSRPLPVSADHPDLIFYDFETFATENGVHVPFLVYAKTLKGEEKWFYGHGCVKHFLMYFRNERYRRNVFIAHNAKGFDSYLVLKGMLKEGLSPRHILMTGSKILSFEDPHYELKFIDSLSFLPMRLSDFPKALGFTDQTKGYFPHKFSSAERL